MRSPRLIPVFIGLALAATAVAIMFRVQPPRTATVFRDRSRVAVRRTPIYVRIPGASACRVPIIGERLAFEGNAEGDHFTVHVRFTYSPPTTLPDRWPGGDWCQSLARRIRVPAVSTIDVLDHRRESGDRIATAIENELRADGVAASAVSARIDVPPGFDRLRPVPQIASRAHGAPPVIFIGLDGADWSLLDGYMASGAMPNLKKLVESGTRSAPQTEMPPLSPIVWTTMMTGAGPLQHQILDFARFNPTTDDKEPITSDERRAPAIWNMLDMAGKSCAQFGLWATYAAEPVQAINVSDRLFTFLYSNAGSAIVYPPNKQAWAEAIARDAESLIGLARVREFIPSATDSELATGGNPYANPVSGLRRILVDTEIYRRLSLEYLKTHRPDVTIVYFEGTDSIGHVFAPFAPPKQPRVSQTDYDRYNAVPEEYFRYVDTIIGDYLPIGTVVIASDHGFLWGEGRPTEVSSTATATAAKWHAPHGIFVGPRGETPPRGIRDVCGYLRRLTGLPDADYARYFQRAAPPPTPPSGAANDEALAKLKALGYIGSTESPRSAITGSDTKTAGAYNNAGLIQRNENHVDDAIASFEHAMAIDPHYASAMWNLSETLFKRDPQRSDDLLIAALQNGLADGTKYVIQRSLAYKNERSLALLEKAVAAAPNDSELRIFRGRYRMDRHDCNGALADFIAAEASNNALAYASAGLAQMCLGDSAAAQASFAKARQLDPSLQLPQ
jgi:type I phosphodiesterase/nucleotide pyrophosphatase/tetratricopeptide repeat protein